MYYRFILSNNGNVATIGKYRYHSRFFVRVGHETTYMSNGNHHFVTTVKLQALPWVTNLEINFFLIGIHRHQISSSEVVCKTSNWELLIHTVYSSSDLQKLLRNSSKTTKFRFKSHILVLKISGFFFSKMCLIFVGSLYNFGRSEDDMI